MHIEKEAGRNGVIGGADGLTVVFLSSHASFLWAVVPVILCVLLLVFFAVRNERKKGGTASQSDALDGGTRNEESSF